MRFLRNKGIVGARDTRARLDAIDCRGEPSGRLLESRREARPRGMIAAARRRLRQHAAQNPAYRPVRHFSMTYGHFVRLQPTLSIERDGCGPALPNHKKFFIAVCNL